MILWVCPWCRLTLNSTPWWKVQNPHSRIVYNVKRHHTLTLHGGTTMTLDSYIEALVRIRELHGGDIPIVDEEAVDLAFPEYIEDPEPCVVACEKR